MIKNVPYVAGFYAIFSNIFIVCQKTVKNVFTRIIRICYHITMIIEKLSRGLARIIYREMEKGVLPQNNRLLKLGQSKQM